MMPLSDKLFSRKQKAKEGYVSSPNHGESSIRAVESTKVF
jgi:hypothetical protein